MAGGSQKSLDTAVAMMQQDGAPAYQIDHFARQFKLVAEGFDGLILEESIRPLEEPMRLESLPAQLYDSKSGYRVASLKLNGGMGTTMGLDGPKSLLPVKDGKTFLAIVLEQYAQHHQGDRLLLMNSFYTHAKTTEFLGEAPPDGVDCFQQGRVPRLQEGNLMPLDAAVWGDAAWCPPGHGQVLDVLAAGLADDLRSQGVRYVFISNIDNLGATVDPVVPEYMKANSIPWLTEVSQRDQTDIKGGHVAIYRDSGELLVRDSNMTAETDMPAYSDIARHRFFSTNNHWLDLEALDTPAFKKNHDLPLIVNHKQVKSPTSEAKIIQLETGIGTAIGMFKGAQAMLVPRSRFIPVKDIPQWLLVRSDWFTLQADGLLVEPDAANRPAVNSNTIHHGSPEEALQYYLSHPDFEHHLGQENLQ
ncbi:MAG: UTP--glucose-phosphate uridylyltransferase [Candidatus Saccharibacteria bacterium]|nr:UTP--glucose-phosphate uridylyltransferase [Candidatus Saccharibacteria bacterium]